MAGYGSDTWGWDPWSGDEIPPTNPEENRRRVQPAPQNKRRARVDKARRTRTYEVSNDVSAIQENFLSAQKIFIQFPLGIPTNEIRSNVVLKFNDIALIDASSDKRIQLQESTKQDVGKQIMIKNISTAAGKIEIMPTPFTTSSGMIDDLYSYVMEQAGESIIMICTGKNEWISLKG